MSNLKGKTLGRYKLGRLIGKGGMADVYESDDPKYGKVAVKVFTNKEKRQRIRFEREANLMRSLRNRHLVPIYDFGSNSIDDVTWFYIVMPYMQGGTLNEHIRNSPPSLPDTCAILSDIADALDYIHSKGIIHRDIKPSNVLLDAHGHCYLADFGIAHVNTDETRLTSAGNVMGTFGYLAPELFEADHITKPPDAHSDLYSLGVLLFKMVTCQLPLFTQNLAALLEEHYVPKSAAHVILRSLAREPEQRYCSATELADAFRQAISLPTVRSSLTLSLSPEDLVSPDEPTLREKRWETPIPPKTRVYPLPQPLQRRDPRIWLVIITAIMALLIVVITVPVVGMAIKGSTLPSGDITATSMSQAQATSKAQSQKITATANAKAQATTSAIVAATATARVQIHATAQAQVTATARIWIQATETEAPIATATSGTPGYIDPLNNPNNTNTQNVQWDGLDGNDSQCGFNSDGYHVKQGTGGRNLHACREATYQVEDAAITVDISIFNGNSGGLFFRFQTDFWGNYSGYLFEIDSFGHYKISNFGGDTLQDWTFSPLLKTGYNVTNTLKVKIMGNTFAFYANKGYLTTLTDNSPNEHASGNIAFFASAPTADTEVVFSNLAVYPLS